MTEKKNSGKGSLIVVLIMLVLAVLGLSTYIFMDKNKLLETDKTNDDNTNTEKNKIQSNSESCKCSDTSEIKFATPKCTGTYSGAYPDGGSIVYTLNQDYTFKVNYSGLTYDVGTYAINDNTVTFITGKHTAGPAEEDPHYNSVDYIVSADCSYIKIPATTTANGSTSAIVLNKK